MADVALMLFQKVAKASRNRAGVAPARPGHRASENVSRRGYGTRPIASEKFRDKEAVIGSGAVCAFWVGNAAAAGVPAEKTGIADLAQRKTLKNHCRAASKSAYSA